MKEKNFKKLILSFTEQYGYLLENIRSKMGNSELWTVSKNINGEQCRLIFTTKSTLDELRQYDIPEDKNNIYILFFEDEIDGDKDAKNLKIKEILEKNDLLEKPLIKVEIKEKKVTYSENVNLEVVQDLARVMSNSNLLTSGEKVRLRDRPYITIGIIVINIIMYVLTAYLSYVYGNGSLFDSDTRVLILLGAKVNELIAHGQYFRLITCMFLHGGIVHLVVNMYSLYAIGPMVERVYGRIKYIAIYFISGICSSIFSYMFSTSVSIGASGAIFGLLGAVLVYAIKAKGKTGNAFIKNILSVIFVNIFIGMTLPNIDNFGHIGGLIGGIIIAFLSTFKTEI